MILCLRARQHRSRHRARRGYGLISYVTHLVRVATRS